MQETSICTMDLEPEAVVSQDLEVETTFDTSSCDEEIVALTPIKIDFKQATRKPPGFVPRTVAAIEGRSPARPEDPDRRSPSMQLD